jgi:membrane protein
VEVELPVGPGSGIHRRVALPQAPRRAHKVLLGGLRAIGAALDRAGRDNITGAASQFAYSAFLATIPFLIVLVSLVGLAGSAGTIRRVLDVFGSGLPDQVNEQLQQALVSATRNSASTALALVLASVAGLYVTSNAIGAILRALEDVNGVQHRSWWRSRLVALGLAALGVVLAVITSFVLVGGPGLIDNLATALSLPDVVRRVSKSLSLWLGLLGILVFTVILYRLGPNAPRMRTRDVLPGALLAVGMWYGATRLFRLYVDSYGSYNRIYGSLVAIVVYLIFLWLTGLVLLVGAEVNAALERRRRRHRWQDGHQ